MEHRPPLAPLLALALVAACATPGSPGASGVPHYLDSGGTDTQALVLVHGWASSTESWRHQFPDLADLGRVLAVDLPGHGASAPPANGYSMAGFADAIAAAMDDAGVREAVLVGHSNGVPVIAHFYRRHPERTLALVGLDGTLKQLFDAETFEPAFAPFRGEDWREVMSEMIAAMPGPGLADDDRAAIEAMALGTRHEAVIGGAEATLDPAAWSEAPIEVPLLLIHARQPTWDADYEAFVRRLAPQVDYRVWDGVGHYLQMERPAELRAALEEFLAAHALLR